MIEHSLIDSHCHVVFPNFQEDLDEVAKRWREVGVKSLLHACVEPSEIPSIRALADRFPEMRYSVGVHPLDTEHWNDETINILKKAALDDSRVVAIGELGLDLFKDKNVEKQLSILMPQLELAVELDLPVIVHCRDAADEMLSAIKNLCLDGNQSLRGVMHCWSGSPEEMRKFLAIGFYVSFSGNVTFPKAYATHNCAIEVPHNRFLIETDCPFLSPAPLRGKRNEPSNVKLIAQRIADLRGESFGLIAENSTANARQLFCLP